MTIRIKTAQAKDAGSLVEKLKKYFNASDGRNAAIGATLGALLMGGSRAMSDDDEDGSTVVGEALKGALGGGVAGYAVPRGLSLLRDAFSDKGGGNNQTAAGGGNNQTAANGKQPYGKLPAGASTAAGLAAGGATAAATGVVGAGVHAARSAARSAALTSGNLPNLRSYFSLDALKQLKDNFVSVWNTNPVGRYSESDKLPSRFTRRIRGLDWGEQKTVMELANGGKRVARPVTVANPGRGIKLGGGIVASVLAGLLGKSFVNYLDSVPGK